MAEQGNSSDGRAVLRRNPDVQWRRVGDEILIVHVGLKQYHVLNSVAARIWELSEDDRSIEQIVSGLAVEYSADRQLIAQDVLETVEGLKALQLLQSESGPFP
jgi:hypothetical protein